MKKLFYYVIFVLFVVISSFNSCSSSKSKDQLIIYFDNLHFDDGPLNWPNFSEYENLNDGSINELEDEGLSLDEFTFIKDKLQAILSKAPSRNKKNILNGYDDNVYINLNYKDSVYFNKRNEFYNTNNEFLDIDKQLADSIKSQMHYVEFFKMFDKNSFSIYSKVKLTRKDN